MSSPYPDIDQLYLGFGTSITFPLIFNQIRYNPQSLQIINQSAATIQIGVSPAGMFQTIAAYTPLTIIQWGFGPSVYIRAIGAPVLQATDFLEVDARAAPFEAVGPQGEPGPPGPPGATNWQAGATPTTLTDVPPGTPIQAWNVRQVIALLTGVMNLQSVKIGRINNSNILALGGSYLSPINPTGLYLAPDTVNNRLANAVGEYIQFRVGGRNFGAGSAADALAAELRLSNITDAIGFNNAFEATIVFDPGGAQAIADARVVQVDVVWNDAAGTGTITRLAMVNITDPGPPLHTLAVTTAYGLYIDRITAGATNYSLFVNGGISEIHGTLDVDNIQAAGRIEEGQGANVGTANNLTLGGDGNYFRVTGSTQINLLDNTNWQGGSQVTIKSNDGVTFKHNQAASSTFRPLILSGQIDYACPPTGTITFVYDATDAVWYETARSSMIFTPILPVVTTITGTGDVGSSTGNAVTSLPASAIALAGCLQFQCNTARATVAVYRNTSDTVPIGNSQTPGGAEVDTSFMVGGCAGGNIAYKVSGTSAQAWTITIILTGYWTPV